MKKRLDTILIYKILLKIGGGGGLATIKYLVISSFTCKPMALFSSAKLNRLGNRASSF